LRKCLAKRYFGIPLVAWMLLVAAAGLGAAYVVTTVTRTASVDEPFTITVEDELVSSLWPGEDDELIIKVSNASGAPAYTVTFTITASGPTGTSFSYESSTDGTTWVPYTSGTGLPIASGGDQYLKVGVSIASDGATGTISVSVDVDRS